MYKRVFQFFETSIKQSVLEQVGWLLPDLGQYYQGREDNTSSSSVFRVYNSSSIITVF